MTLARPPAVGQLRDVICEFQDVLSTSKTDCRSCSLTPFEISVPDSSAPGTPRPHRMNAILANEVDAALDQYLAAGLIQHSISPYSSPLVVIPKNYKKLNQISKLSQLPITRAPGPGLLKPRTGAFLVRIGFLAPPDNGA